MRQTEKRKATLGRKFQYFRQNLVLNLAWSFGVLWGVAVAVTTIWAVQGLIKPSCPSVQGRVCNGQGVCTSAGLCNCTSPLYSGDSCSETLCLGYDETTGLTCGSDGNLQKRGVCSPFMTLADVPSECRQIQPSRENGFVREGLGWAAPECKVKIDSLRRKLETQTYSIEEMAGCPLCYCRPPFSGPDCLTDACPRNVQEDICSGFGNTSVGLMNNRTDRGNGCQCTSRIDVLKKMNDFSLEVAENVDAKHFGAIADGFCGKLVESAINGNVKFVVPVEIPYKCYCDEKHEGVACELGVCPVGANDLVCSGNGNPLYGFGAQLNGTTKLADDCVSVCSSGTFKCDDGRCVADEKLCDTPTSCDSGYRCPDGSCASPPRTDPDGELCASLGLIYGNLDDLNSVICNPVVLPADGGTFEELLRANRTNFACAGDESTVEQGVDGRKWFVPNGRLTFDSPLRRFQIYVADAKRIEIVYLSGSDDVSPETRSFVGPGTFHGEFVETLEEIDDRLFVTASRNVSAERVDGDDTWNLFPVPWRRDAIEPFPEEFAICQLHTDARDVVVDVISTFVKFDRSGRDAVAEVNQAGIVKYLMPYGRTVASSECFDDLKSCVWDPETLLSADGLRKLCLGLEGGPVSSADLDCDPPSNETYTLRRVDTGATVRSRVVGTDLSNVEWNLRVLDASNTFSVTFVNPDSARARDFKWLTVDAMRRPCVCQDGTKNASSYDAEWKLEQNRVPPSNVGDYFVGEYKTSSGDSKLVRGVSTRSEFPFFGIVAGSEIRVTNPIKITATEFSLGVPTCVADLFPTRCPDGSCSVVTTVTHENVSVSCTCTRTVPGGVPTGVVLDSTNDVNALENARVGGATLGTLVSGERTDDAFPGTSFVSTCECTDDFDSFECTCDSSKCVCGAEGAYDFENSLWERETGLDGLCTLVPSGNERRNTTATEKSSVEYEIETTNSGFLVEIDFDDCEAVVSNLTAVSSVYSDVYENVSFEYYPCGSSGVSVLIPTYDFSLEYDRFIITFESPPRNHTITALWSGKGIPVQRDYSSVFANENSDTASDALRNDATYWSSSEYFSYVGVDFDESRYLTGAYVHLNRSGLTRDDGFLVRVRVYLQATNEPEVDHESDWITVAWFLPEEPFSGEYVPLPVPGEYRHVRLMSRAPMSVRLFVPLTNQICFALLTTTNDEPPAEFVETLLAKKNAAYDLSSVPCVCRDDCVLKGPAGKDGVCSDEKYVASVADRINFTVVTGTSNLSTFFGLDLDNWTYVGDGVWLAPNASFPENYDDLSNETFPVLVNDTFAYRKGPPADNFRVTEEGTFEIYYESYRYKGHDSFCAAGTDCTDCGASCRLTDAPTKVPWIPPTAAESAALRDQLNRTDRFTNRTALFSEYTRDYGLKARYNQTGLTRTVIRAARTGCDDCDGLWRCPDGTCATSASVCPETRWDCPGDGCVLGSLNGKDFMCACKEGFAGIDCGYGKCDSTLSDVNAWCTAGGPPPLRSYAKNAFVADLKRLVASDVERKNRRTPTRNARDVRDDLIRAEFAPFRPQFPRWIKEGNVSLKTNCPFLAKGPLGQPLLMEDCVRTRNARGEVEEWTEFEDLNGNKVKYIWKSTVAYDDFPIRCPNNGRCVSKSSDCFLLDRIKPLCGGPENEARADGTCKCKEGKKTFVFTKEFSKYVSIPYKTVRSRSPLTSSAGKLNLMSDDAVQTNPIAWGTQNTNWRDWSSHWCKAKDCAKVDCGVPKGCFTGTKSADYKDRLIACPQSSGHFGKCAVDFQACGRGEVTDPIPCSGNGQPRLRDYRTDEWYCECGYPKSRLADTSTPKELPELEKNGWGGEACDEYDCPEDPKLIWWSKYDESTGTFWKDRFGGNLPGKWMGPCGVPVGPSPDDVDKLSNCCPMVQLEMCDKVLCKIGDKVSCVHVDVCSGPERVPQVYPCNGHGTPRADGTCDCEKNKETGVGYMHDYQSFSYDGCFKKIACALSKRTQKPCNYVPPCKRFDDLILPKEPYLEQNVWSLMAREGEQLSNRTFVRKIVAGLGQLQQVKMQAYVRVAQEVLTAITQLSACICVYPNEHSDDPCCMSPYDDRPRLRYERGFDYPYELTPNDPTNVLTDGKFFSKWYDDGGAKQYAEMTASNSFRSTLVFDFDGVLTKIAAIRIFALYEGTAPVRFNFVGDSGLACGPLVVPATDDFVWIGPDNGHYCVPTYTPYRFNVELPIDYQSNCAADETALKCTTWKDSVCPYEINLPGSLNLLNGCQNERCCKPLTGSLDKTTRLTIQFDNPERNTVLETIKVSEVRVFGWTDTVQKMPSVLKAELRHLDSSSGECFDNKYMTDTLRSRDGDFFVFRNWSKSDLGPVPHLTYDEATDACASAGGVPASILGDNNLAAYADEAGDACFAVEGNEECLMSAKNVNDAVEPPLSQFVEESCSLYGCWLGPDSGNDIEVPVETRGVHEFVNWRSGDPVTLRVNLDRTSLIDWYFTPNRDQWKTPRTSNGVTTRGWDEYLYYLYNEARRQTHVDLKLPPKGAITRVKFVPETVVTSIAGCELLEQLGIECGYVNNGYENDDFDDFVKPYSNVQPLRTVHDLYGSPFKFHPDGFELTSRSQEPTVPENRTRPGIAYWTNPQVCKLTLYSDTQCCLATGCARYTLLFGPGNDYDNIMNNDVLFFLYRECWTGGTNCPYYSYGVQWTVKSFALDGPCFVAFYAHAPRREGAYLKIFESVSEFRNEQRTIRNGAVKGCYPNYGKYAIPGWFGGNTDHMLSVKVIPNFQSFLVETSIRAPDDDEEGERGNMGWKSNPHACFNVEFKIHRVIQPGMKLKTGLVWEDFEYETYYKDMLTDVLSPDYGPNSLKNVLKYDVATSTWIKTNYDFERFRETDYSSLFDLNDWIRNVPVNFIRVPEVELPAENRFWYEIEHYFRLTNDDIARVMDGELPRMFARCVGREIKHCPACVKKDAAEYMWDQRLKGPETTFSARVTKMRQTSPTESEVVIPEIYDGNGTKLSTFLNTDRKYYGHRVVNLKAEDYRSKFFLDQCVRVVPSTGAPRYKLESAICEFPRPVLCQRDVTKYTAQDGMMCDVCGTSSRVGGAARTNSSCFEQFSLASEEAHPFEHRIKNAYLDGTLSLLVATLDYDYDAAAKFLLESNESLVTAWPEMNSLISAGFSDRRGRLSVGATENPRSWVDADMKRMWPYPCGEVVNPVTGIAVQTCAVSVEHCPWNNRLEGSLMAVEDYPTILLPYTGDDPTTEPACCVTVRPDAYDTRDRFGGPSPEIVNLRRKGTSESGGLLLEATGDNGTWSHSGKNSHGYVFAVNRTTTITGTVDCESCEMYLWVATMDVTFLKGSKFSKYSVANVTVDGETEYSAEIDVPDDGFTYQTIEFAFTGMRRGEIVELSRALLSDDETIALCRSDEYRNVRPFVEPSSTIESGTPTNECIFDETRRSELNAPAIGQCFCKGPAFGGETCECPALDTPRGKGVCGFRGDGVRKVVAPDGTIQTTQSDGCYMYGFDDFACVCIDVGAILTTGRNPASAFDYEYVIRTDKAANAEDYVIVTVPTDIPAPPVIASQVAEVCDSGTAALPSWNTADEIESYSAMNVYPTFLDVALENGDLMWSERNVPLKFCGLEDQIEPCGVRLDDPCSDRDICDALNWNNLAYDPDSGNGLVDGKKDLIDLDYGSPLVLNETAVKEMTVLIWSDDSALRDIPLKVSSDSGGDCPQISTVTTAYQYVCSSGGTQLTFSRSPEVAVQLTEVQAYVDGGRNPYFPV